MLFITRLVVLPAATAAVPVDCTMALALTPVTSEALLIDSAKAPSPVPAVFEILTPAIVVVTPFFMICMAFEEVLRSAAELMLFVVSNLVEPIFAEVVSPIDRLMVSLEYAPI